MKKFLSISLVLAMALILCFSFAACKPDSQNVDEFTKIDYSTVLADYQAYPDAANDASMNAIERNVADIYADSSLTDAQKIAQMMERATKNEVECAYFSYFRDQVGESKIDGNHGQLIYQRLRRQSDTLKDDITIKLPVNHNFEDTPASFVTSADIRYVVDGKYYRMNNKSAIVYNKETGLLEVAQWKKQDAIKNWNKVQDAKGSRSYDEARKTCINWTAENIVDSNKTISLTEKQDSNGNSYYELKFSVDVAVANTDSTTIERLENDNSGKNMKYEYCDLVVEIWKNGLTKRYEISESWSGEIGALIFWYEGSATSKSVVIFSYSERDLDYSKTDAIYRGIAKK